MVGVLAASTSFVMVSLLHFIAFTFFTRYSLISFGCSFFEFVRAFEPLGDWLSENGSRGLVKCAAALAVCIRFICAQPPVIVFVCHLTGSEGPSCTVSASTVTVFFAVAHACRSGLLSSPDLYWGSE